MKTLIAEFLAFLISKLDERYNELEARVQQLEKERLLIGEDKDTQTRLESLERKVFWERFLK